MALTGNVGEWSEIYTFFRLLADGELFSADGKLNRIEDLRYPIKKVFRDDSPNRVEYSIDSVKKHVVIASKTKSIQLPQEEFDKAAQLFLAKIQERRKAKGAFEFPEIEDWMKKVLVENISPRIRSIVGHLQNPVFANSLT